MYAPTGTSPDSECSRRSLNSCRSRNVAAVAGSLAAVGSLAKLAAPKNVHAAGSEELKIGLIGCGGRGSGAASQALKADSKVKLWAMADAFEDRLVLSLNSLQKIEEVAPKLD